MTSSEIKYLFVIYRDSKNDKGLSSMDIADMLGYSKVSVYKAINRFEEKNIIIKKDKKIFLTENGLRAYAFYDICFKSLVSMFSKAMGCEERDINEDAVKILGVLSKRNLECLYKKFYEED